MVWRALTTIAAILLFLPAVTRGQTAEDKAVRAAIDQYFRGHATANPAEMRKAFLPTAHIEGNRDGKFVSWTAEEYSSRFTGKPAADEASRKRTIDRVEISGTAAMASATLVHGPTTFTDYFVLLKVNGEWKIANKVYSSRPTK
jgi:Putative lumazine-binding